MFKKEPKFLLSVLMATSFLACNGKRNNPLLNPNGTSELANQLNERPSSAVGSNQNNPNTAGRLPNESTGNVTSTKPCTTGDCGNTNTANTTNKPATLVGDISDDIQCNAADQDGPDFDLDGLSDACEETLQTNPQCYNGYLVSGVLLNRKILKDMYKETQNGLGRLGTTLFGWTKDTNDYIDEVIYRLSKLNKSEAMSVIKSLHDRHWTAESAKVKEGDDLFGKTVSGFPLQMQIAPSYDLKTILLNGGAIKDDESIKSNSEKRSSKVKFAVVPGGRSHPILTSPADSGQGRITGLVASGDNLDGQGAYVVFAEAYLTRPGRYDLFTGVLTNGKQIYYTAGNGNYFIVTVDHSTVLTSSVGLAARGEANPAELSDHRTKGTFVVQKNSRVHLMVAAVVRKDTNGGQYVNDTVFVKFTGNNGVSRKKFDETGEALPMATFLQQADVQISSGQNLTDAKSLLQKPLFSTLEKLTDEKAKGAKKALDLMRNSCSMTVAEATKTLSEMKAKHAKWDAEDAAILAAAEKARASDPEVIAQKKRDEEARLEKAKAEAQRLEDAEKRERDAYEADRGENGSEVTAGGENGI